MRTWAKLGIVIIVCISGALLQGCATLNSSVPFRYVPSLITGEPTDLRLGMEKLADKRPEGDRSATESISDIDDKTTSKLLEDFRTTQIFAAVDYPPQPVKDDFIMKGEIRRFYWKLTPEPYIFIPFVGCIVYFGAPAHTAEGIAELSVQLVNPKTGAVLSKYERIATKKTTYTIYNFKAGEAGSELADAFRDVSKQIKDSIVEEIKAGLFKKQQ
jgi:hypothetical protein